MFVAIAKPHQQFPVPLTIADYEFSTSDDGDERGRVTLPPGYARSGVMTQIGDELIIYCTQLSKTIWRGQIERIEEARDGSITWHALGFGALQRDARVSVVLNMDDMTRWKPVGSEFMPNSGFSSRGDLWEYEIDEAGGFLNVRIRTKRTFAVYHTTLFFLAYLYEQPERYAYLSTSEQISVFLHSVTGLATGVWVTPVTAIPSPNAYTLTLGTFTGLTANGVVSATGPFGWVIGIRVNAGNETTIGATSVTFRATINAQNINAILLTNALNGSGGCCEIKLPSYTSVKITKNDANLRDIIEQSLTTSVRYHKKRFLRDRTDPTIDFLTDSTLVWRFPETMRVIDISKAPNRVYGQYRGYWTEHLTTTTSITSLEKRRQLTWRVAGVGEYGSKTAAEERRNEAAVELDQQIAPLTTELNNSRYELMMREGVTVPNWAADVSDYVIVPGYFRNAKIMSRTITRERTTYTVSFNPDDFVTALR